MVYSDGLAAVSVFIEPLEGRRDPVRTGPCQHGRDPHLYARGRQPHGDRGRRGAGRERAAHRQRGRVPPSAVDKDSGDARCRAVRALAALWLAAVRAAALAQARELPDFTRLVEEQGTAVVNISTTQAVRRSGAVPQVPGHRGRGGAGVLPPLHPAPASPGQGPGPGASAREPLARLGLHHQRRRLHPHQRARRRRRRRDHRQAHRQARVQGQGDRRRPAHRRRADQDRGDAGCRR